MAASRIKCLNQASQGAEGGERREARLEAEGGGGDGERSAALTPGWFSLTFLTAFPPLRSLSQSTHW